MRRIAQVMVVAGVVGLAGGTASADPITPPGVTATGSGGHLFIQGACSTCPRINDRRSDSASGATEASTELTEIQPFKWLASGQILTGTYLPELKAFAAAFNPQGPPDIFSMSTNATAAAQALQLFTYDGVADEEFTIEYTVDGVISGNRGSITAGIGVFSGDYIPVLEGEGQNTRIALDRQAATTAGSFVRIGSVTFSVMPGDVFYIASFLTANAFWTDGDTGSIADAAHTMTAVFTAGDPSLLRPTVPGGTSIPEPASLSLTIAGLAAATAWRRRRT